MGKYAYNAFRPYMGNPGYMYGANSWSGQGRRGKRSNSFQKAAKRPARASKYVKKVCKKVMRKTSNVSITTTPSILMKPVRVASGKVLVNKKLGGVAKERIFKSNELMKMAAFVRNGGFDEVACIKGVAVDVPLTKMISQAAQQEAPSRSSKRMREVEEI